MKRIMITERQYKDNFTKEEKLDKLGKVASDIEDSQTKMKVRDMVKRAFDLGKRYGCCSDRDLYPRDKVLTKLDAIYKEIEEIEKG